MATTSIGKPPSRAARRITAVDTPAPTWTTLAGRFEAMKQWRKSASTIPKPTSPLSFQASGAMSPRAVRTRSVSVQHEATKAICSSRSAPATPTMLRGPRQSSVDRRAAMSGIDE